MIHNEAEETTLSKNKVSVQNKKDGMMKGEGEGGQVPLNLGVKSVHVLIKAPIYTIHPLSCSSFIKQMDKTKSVDFAAKMSTKNSPWLLRSTFSITFLWFFMVRDKYS